MRAEVTKLPPSSLLNSGPGDLKDSVQMVLGERALGLESVFLHQDLLGIYLQMSVPTPAFTTPPGEVLERPSTPYLELSGKPKSIREPPREEHPRVGAAAPTRPARLPKADLS